MLETWNSVEHWESAFVSQSREKLFAAEEPETENDML